MPKRVAQKTEQAGSSTIMTIRLSPELKTQIEQAAKRSGRSTNNLIVWLLENFVRMPLAEKARANPGYYEDDDFYELLGVKKEKRK